MGRITILGQHVRLIRPAKINMPIVRKKDLPKATYDKSPKTIKEHCGRVVAVCVRLKNGGIRSLTKGRHVDVMKVFDIDSENVATVGWQLENGNYLWKM